MTFFELLQTTGLPAAYNHFDEDQDPPFIVYYGGGQEQFYADNEIYEKENTYQVEYYFTTKDEEAEAAIEEVFESAGFFYSKSPDTYIDDQEVSVIYYDVWRKGYKNESDVWSE